MHQELYFNPILQRYALALMSIEYYHVYKTEPTKSIDNITKDIKDRDNKKKEFKTLLDLYRLILDHQLYLKF